MNYVDKNKLVELKRWVREQQFTVFGTLKFTDGTVVSDEHGERTVRAYFNALDRAYFGNAVSNTGMRHKRIVFKHYGTSGANLHYHFLAKPCTDPTLYVQLARRQWAKMSGWTMSLDDTVIERVRSETAVASYVLHEFSMLGTDSLCLSASSLTPPTRSPNQFRNLAQLRRLLRLHEDVAHEAN